jgi:hypothetical protein
MKKLKTFLVIFILFFPLNILLARNTTALYLYIQEIKAARPPLVFDDSIIFTYQPQNVVYFIGARFEHENYSILHKYEKNSKGLFILVLPIPDNVVRLKYRIVVDGLWMEDPFNPEIEEDELGVRHSLFLLPPKLHKYIISPEILGRGLVKFNLKAQTNTHVFIAGDFNNWDPFIDKLKEESPGIYTVTLKLYPGRHYYYFLVNGRRVIDPHNVDVKTDMDSLQVSSFIVPEY